MEVATVLEIISNFGFPIAIVIVLGWFLFKIYTDNKAQHKENLEQSQKNMEAVQARCKEREDKLYNQLEKQNEINGRFAEIIAQYEVKLDEIKGDVKEIKEDVLLIKAKTE